MLADAAGDVVCDASIKCAHAAAGEDVNVSGHGAFGAEGLFTGSRINFLSPCGEEKTVRDDKVGAARFYSALFGKYRQGFKSIL